MSHDYQLYGLELCGFTHLAGIYYRGRSFPFDLAAARQLRTLGHIVERREDESIEVGWLLKYRNDFREMMQDMSPAVLAVVVERSRVPAMRRLAIWLLGRHTGTLGTKAIARHMGDSDVILRREVARALRRKQAWSEMRALQADDPDSRIRKLATQATPDAHQRRLRVFLDDISSRPVHSPRAPSTWNVDLSTAPGRPPKSEWLIRRLLEHIRLLVHGKAKHLS